MSDYEITVQVVCYNPEWEKLRLTLQSILLQKKCRFKIVVSDDGSKENYFNRIRKFFRDHAFEDYALIASKKNYGTVWNSLQGSELCEGEYTKGISPGDMLHGFLALRNWIDFMRKNPSMPVSFGDAIYYHWKEGKIVTESRYAHPQQAFISADDNVMAYLIYDDICLGAAMLFRQEQVIPYLKMLRNKVIYAEDNVFRMMCYFGESFLYYPKSPILYEYGSGISTSGSRVWSERLRKDWLVSNKIMLEEKPCEAALKKRVPEFLALAEATDVWSRLEKWKICPSRLWFRLSSRLFPRRTPTELECNFVQALMEDSTFV